MPAITIESASESKYRVTIEDQERTTRHVVTVTPADVARYAPGASAEQLLEASFNFLLEREPASSILPSFKLPVIERYFPEYPRVIGRHLAR
jgi:hypothetical protein